MLPLIVLFCPHAHSKWENDFYPFPWQSPDRRPKQLLKCMTHLFMETCISLLIYCEKNMLRKMTPKSRFCIEFNKIFLLSACFLYCTWCIWKPKQNYTYSYTYIIHFSFSVFNFMLPACRPNSVEATQEVGHTCFSVTTHAICFLIPSTLLYLYSTGYDFWNAYSAMVKPSYAWCLRSGLQQTNPCSLENLNEWKKM